MALFPYGGGGVTFGGEIFGHLAVSPAFPRGDPGEVPGEGSLIFLKNPLGTPGGSPPWFVESEGGTLEKSCVTFFGVSRCAALWYAASPTAFPGRYSNNYCVLLLKSQGDCFMGSLLVKGKCQKKW